MCTGAEPLTLSLDEGVEPYLVVAQSRVQTETITDHDDRMCRAPEGEYPLLNRAQASFLLLTRQYEPWNEQRAEGRVIYQTASRREPHRVRLHRAPKDPTDRAGAPLAPEGTAPAPARPN